jgi:hypothetical protein
MYMLQALEKKVVALVSLVDALKQENNSLKEDISGFKEENKKLKKQVEMLESSVLKESNRLQEQLQKEKELTKTVVDDLIKNIDALLETNSNYHE